MDCDHTENISSIVHKVQKFLQVGCGCRQGLKGGQCSDYFTVETKKITVKIVCFFESFIVSKDRKSQGLIGQLENNCFQLSI